ncbi:MAG: succinoglycan biosynthesis transport protein ExoP, partial [Gammaproteobacteria bacterium]
DGSTVPNVRVIDRAEVPSAPYKPNKRRMIIVAGLVGLFVGIGLAFFRERLDNTFRTPATMEEKLGISSLGVVPLITNEHVPEREVLENPRSLFTENINHIRTGLLFSNIDNPPQMIAITSASSSEGKTTLSANLAAAFAQLDRTLLIEVDLRKPVLARRLGIASVPGITDLVAGQVEREQCLHQVSEKSPLFVISCGAMLPNPLEFLSSARFAETLAELREHFTYIVLDGPPALAVSDAAVIGHLADAVILAVKAESTTHKMSQEAVSRLNRATVRITGGVLCQADIERMAEYGGGYYYADNYSHDAASDRETA